MSATRTRLARLETRWLRAIVQPIAAEYGLDPDELLEDARQFLHMSDAEVDARLAAEIAQAAAEGDAAHVRILEEGWAALKSSR